MKYIRLDTVSVYHEGDQRSRDYPGHGYPAYSQKIPSYTVFKDKTELEAYVLKHSDRTDNIFEITPVKVTKNVTLAID